LTPPAPGTGLALQLGWISPSPLFLRCSALATRWARGPARRAWARRRWPHRCRPRCHL